MTGDPTFYAVSSLLGGILLFTINQTTFLYFEHPSLWRRRVAIASGALSVLMFLAAGDRLNEIRKHTHFDNQPVTVLELAVDEAALVNCAVPTTVEVTESIVEQRLKSYRKLYQQAGPKPQPKSRILWVRGDDGEITAAKWEGPDA